MPCSTFALLTSRGGPAKRNVSHNHVRENGLVSSEQFQELTKVLKKESINLMDEMKKHTRLKPGISGCEYIIITRLSLEQKNTGHN
jgi:hypothetical protein